MSTLLSKAARIANRLLRRAGKGCRAADDAVLPEAMINDAKALWRNKRNECQTGPALFEALEVDERAKLKRVLEFGCNWGGNLGYFLERVEGLTCLGIDINAVVHELEPVFLNRFEGRVGDENALPELPDGHFDLAMTSSVLDHIPSRAVITNVIDQLARVAKTVVLLEPWLEGIEGDVSGKLRAQVHKDLPAPHKPFAPHSYFWNYDAILTDLGLEWSKAPHPLHPGSLGPFYHVYRIKGRHSPS